MEGNDGPAAISIHPKSIKSAQEEMGRLDVLVCGQCHSVFHFINELQEHHSKENACSKQSHFRENTNNDQKAQVWAFLLWKDTQIQNDSPDKDNSWKLYQKWCNMDINVRDCWIMAGKTIQTFTKISNAKMQEVPRQGMITEGGRTVVVRKIIRNGQPESSVKKELKSDVKVKLEPGETKDNSKVKPIKPKGKANESAENNAETSGEEYAVEKILAKRFNPKKKVNEYLLKWEGYAHEYNTWEEVTQVSVTCKQLMDDFERNLAKQKEIKAAQVAKSSNRNQYGSGQKVKDEAKAGPSSGSQSGRPMRSSKSKAMDQVKQWCGSMNDEDNELLGKRKIAFSDSESDNEGLSMIKRSKADTSGDDDWTADSDDEKVVIGRSDVIQRAFSRATAATNGSANNVITNKSKVEPKSQPQNIYIVHRKDGVIKLDSSPTNKMTVKGSQNQTAAAAGGVLLVQNRDATGNVVRKVVSSQSNSITPVKVVSKADGTQIVTQMKVVPKVTPSKTPGVSLGSKNELVKIQPKPEPNQYQQIQLITAIPSPLSIQPQRMATAVKPATGQHQQQRTADNRPLLPRPAGIRASTPSTPGVVTVTQTRTPVRAPPPRQITPQGVQQRQVQQRRNTPNTTVMQVSSPGTPLNKPKITVMNQHGKVVQKTVVSPNTVNKPLPKTNVAGKAQTPQTTQQKINAVRKKAAEQAGVLPKTGVRIGAPPPKIAANRGKPNNPSASTANKPKESKLAETEGMHMEFHQVESESSDDEVSFQALPAEPAQPADPDSPPRDFSLCPLTGRIMGPDGVPIDQPEPEPQPAPPPTPITIAQVPTSTTTATITPDGIVTNVATGETTEIVLPNFEGLTDGSGGIVRVEMSPGGTTGTIVQTNEPAPTISLSNVVVPGPDLPCLDDPSVEVQTTAANSSGIVLNVAPVITTEAVSTTTSSSAALTSAAAGTVVTTTTMTTAEAAAAETILPVVTKQEAVTATTATDVKMEESGGLVTITGDDGVVYQVTGHADDGQTLLVTRGADGEQQCVYVTTTEQQAGEEGTVLTLDHAVAEAVAQLMPDQVNMAPQFYVKEGDEATMQGVEGTTAGGQPVVMSIMEDANTVVATGQEDGENQAQVVAQVIQADEPTPGGTRRVVLLLPDGNLMMTEVDEEQYAALELDK